MLGRFLLAIIQLAAGWVIIQTAARHLPNLGSLTIFVHAIVLAVIIWILGVVAAVVLKDVGSPSSRTLTYTLIGAVIGAAVTLFPQITSEIARFAGRAPALAFPLVGGVLGYVLSRK